MWNIPPECQGRIRELTGQVADRLVVSKAGCNDPEVLETIERIKPFNRSLRRAAAQWLLYLVMQRRPEVLEMLANILASF
ncbi:MAG: hypothetical protein Q7S80_00430 [bacterium]|nr:hypothetical protein [bacterium]